MIRTFEFVFYFQRQKKERQKLLTMMQGGKDSDYDHEGWHLHFDVERRWVRITDNGSDKLLSIKFVPAEMSFKTLEAFLYDEKPETLEIRFLEK